MKKNIIVLALALVIVVGPSSFNYASAAPVSTVDRVTQLSPIPVSGVLAGISSFTGNFDIQRFIVRNGQLLAVGNLTGTLTNILTGATQAVNQVIQIPVTGATGSCQILHLDLGPLNLDLLGLQVHLDRIVLDITAQSGQGNLLGNLLCAVANLLNNGSPLQSLVGKLNKILGQL